ncbi:MAG: hypothetical protein WA294_22130 [Acidobacteriaceae bacterium]
MTAESPMALIRKLDAAAAALGQLAQEVRRAAAQATDEDLRSEMQDSADGLERRATDMAEAIARLRSKIN